MKFLIFCLLFCSSCFGMESIEIRHEKEVAQQTEPAFIEWLYSGKSLLASACAASYVILGTGALKWVHHIGLCNESQEPTDQDCMNPARFYTGVALGTLCLGIGSSALACHLLSKKKLQHMQTDTHLHNE